MRSPATISLLLALLPPFALADEAIDSVWANLRTTPLTPLDLGVRKMHDFYNKYFDHRSLYVAGKGIDLRSVSADASYNAELDRLLVAAHGTLNSTSTAALSAACQVILEGLHEALPAASGGFVTRSSAALGTATDHEGEPVSKADRTLIHMAVKRRTTLRAHLQVAGKPFDFQTPGLRCECPATACSGKNVREERTGKW